PGPVDQAEPGRVEAAAVAVTAVDAVAVEVADAGVRAVARPAVGVRRARGATGVVAAAAGRHVEQGGLGVHVTLRSRVELRRREHRPLWTVVVRWLRACHPAWTVTWSARQMMYSPAVVANCSGGANRG